MTFRILTIPAKTIKLALTTLAFNHKTWGWALVMVIDRNDVKKRCYLWCQDIVEVNEAPLPEV